MAAAARALSLIGMCQLLPFPFHPQFLEAVAYRGRGFIGTAVESTIPRPKACRTSSGSAPSGDGETASASIGTQIRMRSSGLYACHGEKAATGRTSDIIPLKA